MKKFRKYALMLLGLAAVAAVVVIVAQAQQQRQAVAKRGRVAPTRSFRCSPPRRRRSMFPVYLDGVGTTKALNTVTVRPQVDGKLMRILFSEGQDVERGYVLAEIDPDHLPGAVRSGDGQEGAGRGAARQCAARSRALQPPRRVQRGDTPAGRYAEGDGRPARGAGAISTRRRSTTRRRSSATPRSSRRISGRTGIRMVDEGNLCAPATPVPASW